MTTSPRFIDDLQGGMLRMKDMVCLTSLSVSIIKWQVKSSKFSSPVSLGGRSVGWPYEVYEEWRSSLRQYSDD